MGEPHVPPEEMSIVYSWFKKATIDYATEYLKLYIAYNAWYQRATGKTNDREALSDLKKRFIIWDDYLQGRTMHLMNPYFERLVEFTQRDPLTTGAMYWSGSIESKDDWRSLIEYWYQVRCIIAHGGTLRSKYIWYAYESLYIFMEEIIHRMKKCFTSNDAKILSELTANSSESYPISERSQQLQRKLQEKYIFSANIWEVDMKRVRL